MRYAAMLSALLIAAAPASAAAQGSLGVKAGFSYGNVSNSGLLPGDLGPRTGWAAGVSLTMGASLIGFGADALYAQRGVESANDPNSRSLDYVDVPVYLRAALPLPGVEPFAYLGPQFSFEVKCRAGGTDCPDTDRPGTTYAAVIGAGARLGMSTRFSLEGRYLYGLTDLNLSTVTSAESYQTRSFLILAGVGF